MDHGQGEAVGVWNLQNHNVWHVSKVVHNHSCNTGAVYSGGRKILALQGVPKVRYSNFKHYNFCAKRYFNMKFREDVYFSIDYMYSEFQELACLFFRTICSRCGMESDDPFWGFLSPGAQQPVQPSNNICLV